ncbi:MAG: hypothetical protein EOO06_16550, partial [Chitinophagaceae bacterium]
MTLAPGAGAGFGGYVGVRVTDLVHPSNTISTNSISRFWTTSVSGITNYNATATFTYTDADVVGGTEANIKTAKFDGLLWELGDNTIAATNILNISDQTNLSSTTFTGGDNFAPLATQTSDYFRSNVNGGAWTTAASWQSSPDNGVTPWVTSTRSPGSAAAGILIRSGFNINASGTINADDLNIATGAVLTITGGAFTLNNGAAATDLAVSGSLTVSAGTLTTAGAGITFAAGSFYNHAVNGGTIPTATWNAASTCNVTGVTNTIPTGYAQAFGNFTWNCNNQSGGVYINVENNAFSTAGILTVGPAASSLFSFANSAGTFTNTVNSLVISGGSLNVSGTAGTVNLTVTNDINVNGSGILYIGWGGGTSTLNILRDLIISGDGYVVGINDASTPSPSINIGRDLSISNTGSLDLEYNSSSSGVSVFNVARDFICSSTYFPAVDFGDGTVAGNAINIGRNFSKSGSGRFQTFSTSQALGFVMKGGTLAAPATFSYTGANSDWVSYTVDNNAVVQMLTDLTLGSDAANPVSIFGINATGTLNFGTNSIIGNIRARFNTVAGATFITANTGGIGGITPTGSLRNFGTVNVGSQNGQAQLIAGVNYIFNGNTTTPFPLGTWGSPASLTINAIVVSNMVSNLTVSGAVTINAASSFALNSTNNNSLNLGGAMTIAATGTFDNGGENQLVNTGTASISITGRFITRDVQGFTGTNTAVPGISPLLNAGSTVEYGLTGNQAVTTRTDYKNITFSGSGTKLMNGAFNPFGNVYVTGSAILDASSNSFGDNNTNLIMDANSRFRMSGASLKPDIEGTYTLTSGVVEFYNNAGGAQRIKGASAASSPILYNQIEVNGTSVANSGSNITIKDQGGFTVKSLGIFTMNDNSIVGTVGGTQSLTIENNGIFKVTIPAGFNGPGNFPNSPAVRTGTTETIDNISLQPGSTVEYARQTGILPATATDGNQVITIPVSNGSAIPYQYLAISGDGTKTAASPGSTIEIKGNLSKSGTSVFDHNSGTINFNGTLAGQNFSNSSTREMLFYNVVNNNTHVDGLIVNSDSMAIARKLSFGATSRLKLNSGNIIIKSTATNTASIDKIPDNNTAVISYTGSGRFIVERHIAYPGKWNLLGSPLAEGQSVVDSWQEGTPNVYNSNNPYGTRITGPGANPAGNGLDQTSVGYSMKSWNVSTNVFDPVINTYNTSVNQKTGFYLFARGNRQVGTGAVGTSATLRSKGKIFIGNESSPVGLPSANQSWSGLPEQTVLPVANPFASTIDFAPIAERSNNLAFAYYLWDPVVPGGYGVGKYQAFAKSSGWQPTPSGAGLYQFANYSEIQSGQAFFIRSAVANMPTSILFDENDKLPDNSRSVTRGTVDPAEIVLMSTMLHYPDGSVSDGNRVAYDPSFSNAVDREDAVKITNATENFGIRSNSKDLIVEAKKPILETDTIFYKMSNLSNLQYKLSFEPRNLSATGLYAELIDKYLNSRTPVSLTDSTWYTFSATADAASKAADRFMLVFRAPAGPLPVRFVAVAAQRQADRTIAVDWKVANEVNINRYEVQRSANGSAFSSILTNDATGAATYGKVDLSPLSTDNFYR